MDRFTTLQPASVPAFDDIHAAAMRTLDNLTDTVAWLERISRKCANMADSRKGRQRYNRQAEEYLHAWERIRDAANVLGGMAIGGKDGAS